MQNTRIPFNPVCKSSRPFYSSPQEPQVPFHSSLQIRIPFTPVCRSRSPSIQSASVQYWVPFHFSLQEPQAHIHSSLQDLQDLHSGDLSVLVGLGPLSPLSSRDKGPPSLQSLRALGGIPTSVCVNTMSRDMHRVAATCTVANPWQIFPVSSAKNSAAKEKFRLLVIFTFLGN